MGCYSITQMDEWKLIPSERILHGHGYCYKPTRYEYECAGCSVSGAANMAVENGIKLYYNSERCRRRRSSGSVQKECFVAGGGGCSVQSTHRFMSRACSRLVQWLVGIPATRNVHVMMTMEFNIYPITLILMSPSPAFSQVAIGFIVQSILYTPQIMR